MSLQTSLILLIISLTSVLLQNPRFCAAQSTNVTQAEEEIFEFFNNFQFLEAEFYLHGSRGYGLDRVAPNVTMGGPPPIGARTARLDPLTKDIIYQLGLQEIGQIRLVQKTVPGFARPLLNLSAATFADVMNKAFGRSLVPPFNPYANSINYLLASYAIPYVGVTGGVAANPLVTSPVAKHLVAGLLGAQAGQDAAIRTLLYQKAALRVRPYRLTVAAFTDRISVLRNSLGGAGVKDEGLVVSRGSGPEGLTRGNVIIGDSYSLTYARTPQEVLRIMYTTGNETVPGGFFPNGANGTIARAFLPSSRKL